MRKLALSLAILTLISMCFAQTIGVSWSNFQEERWKTDEAAMKGQIEAMGGSYISADAQSSPEKQISDVESLIARGADALIILAQDSGAIGPAIAMAEAEGIPVVGYDRLIEVPGVFYLTFDNVEVGRIQAAEVFKVQPEGNYVFIKGSAADPNADFLHGGQLEILQDAIDSGAINVVGEQYTDGWLPENAQRNMEQILTANDNMVDAVVASNDGTAGGVVAALSAVGLDGIPVSGQDGDHAALNRVARGLQTVSVWKDARALGAKAAEIAVNLAGGAALTDIEGSSVFSGGPKGVDMQSILLAPTPITKDNMSVVVDAGHIGMDVLCQGTDESSPAPCGSGAMSGDSMMAMTDMAEKVIGVSWSNFQEERWKTDEAAMKAVIGSMGSTYISADAQSSPEKQISDVESLIARGADALIILAQDSGAIGPAIAMAEAEGIPVVGYDRLIEVPGVFYLTFDNVEVGRIQAAEVFKVQPEGNYVFIKGSAADPNADFLHGGQLEILQDAIDSGAINVVGEQYTDGWLPENAQRNMEQILTANDNMVDAVVASNDGTAGGVVAALSAVGLDGIPVSGQDGDHAALNRVARGLQTVSVWKDARALGGKAAEIAVSLANGAAIADIEGSSVFSGGPKGVDMQSILLAPTPITKDNMSVVVDAGHIDMDVLCQGTDASSPAPCGDGSHDSMMSDDSMMAAAPMMDMEAKVIGVSWSNFQEERWKTDEAAMKAVIESMGSTYISADAQSSPEKQISDVESLISRGAEALIILAQDSGAIGPAIQMAEDEGIPVLGYDRLIEVPGVFYLTFDNVEVGRIQAAEIFKVQPEGNYVFIKGSAADPNADFLHGGQLEILQDAIDSGAINVVGEQYTDGWLPENAQRNMEQILTANDNNVDAVVASNDGTAGGVVAALSAVGLDGIPVSGQDGDHAALNRVARGLQTVSVWKDARALGGKAAEVAIHLANGVDVSDIDGSIIFSDGPKGEAMNTILLEPTPITNANLNLVIDGGWVSQDVVCQGVDAAMAPAACN